jgi:hypothetical protein
VLVLLEGLFQFFFNRQLYRALRVLVWLTYPAYLLFAYELYREGLTPVWIVLGVIMAWAGTFLLGMFARLPIRLILERAQQGRNQGRQRRNKPQD